MNRRTTGLIVITLALVAMPALIGWEDVRLPNNHKGYAPTQPIAFSHRLHAGALAIDCQYCHAGADSSRHAGVPNGSTCMNCHDKVKGSTERGKAEIIKVAAAFAAAEPIRWVRVHNLPDFVFFNHSAHVHKGVACQTCHGAVEEMGVMRQESDLSMGWCVNCHRDWNARDAGAGMAIAAPLDCAACHR